MFMSFISNPKALYKCNIFSLYQEEEERGKITQKLKEREREKRVYPSQTRYGRYQTAQEIPEVVGEETDERDEVEVEKVGLVVI